MPGRLSCARPHVCPSASTSFLFDNEYSCICSLQLGICTGLGLWYIIHGIVDRQFVISSDGVISYNVAKTVFGL